MEEAKNEKRLSFLLIPVPELKAQQQERMFQLMEESYNCVIRENFLSDLSKKQFAGLLIDSENEVQGFTTFAINPAGTGSETYNILFSGDTIIAPEYWGTQEMIRGGTYAAGRIAAAAPGKAWYWFLMSKGHRTYLYLPFFFQDYYPSPVQENLFLKEILARSASRMFGAYWKEEKGIIAFPHSLGELKPELAAASWKKATNRHVGFFLSRNPDFHKGVELACLAQLHPDNMLGIAKRSFEEGLKKPLYVNAETVELP